MRVYEELDFSPLIHRQVKDQNKKVANLKHKEQVEKKKSAQMLEEARRREDTLSDSSQQLQVGRGPGPGRAGSLPACTWLTLHPPLPLFLTLPAAFLSDQLFSSKGMALNRKGKFYSTALFGNLSKGEGLSPQGDPASLVSSASV